MYYLSAERYHDVVAAYQRYQAYLRQNEERFPVGAFALATVEWYQDPNDHRCPHDGWLMDLTVSEPAKGERHQLRGTELRIRLLGAYHDGLIEFSYPMVFAYRLDASSSTRGLGGWLFDEFRLSERGNLIHEIEWAGFPGGNGARLIIEATDIEFRWIAEQV